MVDHRLCLDCDGSGFRTVTMVDTEAPIKSAIARSMGGWTEGDAPTEAMAKALVSDAVADRDAVIEGLAAQLAELQAAKNGVDDQHRLAVAQLREHRESLSDMVERMEVAQRKLMLIDALFAAWAVPDGPFEWRCGWLTGRAD